MSEIAPEMRETCRWKVTYCWTRRRGRRFIYFYLGSDRHA